MKKSFPAVICVACELVEVIHYCLNIYMTLHGL